jgi:hypothetical protein
MKSYRQILLILLVTTCITYSQTVSVVVENSSESEFPDELLVARYIGADFKTMRNQFTEDWKHGDIVLTSGKVITNQLIRFNNYLNELAWLRETDYRIGILIKESIKEFYFYPENELPKRTFRKMLVTKSFIESDKDLYVQILVEDEDTVICHRKYNKIGNLDEYKLSNQYYLVRKGEFSRFFLHKSSILNLLNDEEKQKMKMIIRSNHLRVRKENGMIKAFGLFYKK